MAVNEVFGRLTVIARAESTAGHLKVRCLCECGTERTYRLSHLRCGATRSCGWLMRETTTKRSLRHGADRRGKRTPEYDRWAGMKARCLNPNDSIYRHYGERGIQICERWLRSFENFLADMGSLPTPKHSLERIDVNGNYEPGNCRWATKNEQARNKRVNTLTEEIAARIREMAAAGVSKIEISRNLGVHYGSVKQVASGKQWA